MIVFHGGLPRSGKSYEALVRRIIPALKSRREVVAYVEGIDHARIAPLADITEDECKALLFVLTREQMVDEVRPEGQKPLRVARWLDHCRDNALHVFDEVQNFWPNRTRLTDEETQFVAEHGHRGIDIVLMGQDYRDVHSLWRRRIELRLEFLKLSAFGTGQRYSVSTWRHKGGDEYDRVGTQVSKYDPKFFGTYKSHVSGDISTVDYKDSRALLWNTPLFKWLLPVAVVAAIWGGMRAWAFFHPVPVSAPVRVMASASAPVAQLPASSPSPSKVVEVVSPQERRFVELTSKGRIRLAGLLESAKRVQGVVEWVDGNTHVMERLTLDQLRDLGVAVVHSEGIVRLSVGAWSEMATMWPLEAEGRVSEARLEGMRPVQQSSQVVAEAPAVAIGIGTDPKRERAEPVAPIDQGGLPRNRPKS